MSVITHEVDVHHLNKNYSKTQLNDFNKTNESVENNVSKCSTNFYSPGSLLGKLFCLQKLDSLGIVQACKLYRELQKRLGSAEKVNNQLKDVMTWKKNVPHMKKLLKEIISSEYDGRYSNLESSLDFKKTINRFDKDKTDQRKKMKSFSFDKSESMSEYKIKNDDKSEQIYKQDLEFEKEERFWINMDDDEIVRSLQKYLFSMTLKDVSIMILLHGPHFK